MKAIFKKVMPLFLAAALVVSGFGGMTAKVSAEEGQYEYSFNHPGIDEIVLGDWAWLSPQAAVFTPQGDMVYLPVEMEIVESKNVNGAVTGSLDDIFSLEYDAENEAYLLTPKAPGSVVLELSCDKIDTVEDTTDVETVQWTFTACQESFGAYIPNAWKDMLPNETRVFVPEVKRYYAEYSQEDQKYVMNAETLTGYTLTLGEYPTTTYKATEDDVSVTITAVEQGSGEIPVTVTGTYNGQPYSCETQVYPFVTDEYWDLENLYEDSAYTLGLGDTVNIGSVVKLHHKYVDSATGKNQDVDMTNASNVTWKVDYTPGVWTEIQNAGGPPSYTLNSHINESTLWVEATVDNNGDSLTLATGVNFVRESYDVWWDHENISGNELFEDAMLTIPLITDDLDGKTGYTLELSIAYNGEYDREFISGKDLYTFEKDASGKVVAVTLNGAAISAAIPGDSPIEGLWLNLVVKKEGQVVSDNNELNAELFRSYENYWYYEPEGALVKGETWWIPATLSAEAFNSANPEGVFGDVAVKDVKVTGADADAFLVTKAADGAGWEVYARGIGAAQVVITHESILDKSKTVTYTCPVEVLMERWNMAIHTGRHSNEILPGESMMVAPWLYREVYDAEIDEIVEGDISQAQVVFRCSDSSISLINQGEQTKLSVPANASYGEKILYMDVYYPRGAGERTLVGTTSLPLQVTDTYYTIDVDGLPEHDWLVGDTKTITPVLMKSYRDDAGLNRKVEEKTGEIEVGYSGDITFDIALASGEALEVGDMVPSGTALKVTRTSVGEGWLDLYGYIDNGDGGIIDVAYTDQPYNYVDAADVVIDGKRATNVVLGVGETVVLTVQERVPGLLQNYPVTIVSSNPEVASIDANGKVTAKKAGHAEITLDFGIFQEGAGMILVPSVEGSVIGAAGSFEKVDVITPIKDADTAALVAKGAFDTLKLVLTEDVAVEDWIASPEYGLLEDALFGGTTMQAKLYTEKIEPSDVDAEITAEFDAYFKEELTGDFQTQYFAAMVDLLIGNQNAGTVMALEEGIEVTVLLPNSMQNQKAYSMVGFGVEGLEEVTYQVNEDGTLTFVLNGSRGYALAYEEADVPLTGTWRYDSNGYWYSLSDGTYYKDCQAEINGKVYGFDKRGYMITGWSLVGGKWYYYDASGAMQTGWLRSGTTWYYMNADGQMCTGWVKVSGKWYYMNSSGKMTTGWQLIGGKWYYLSISGVTQTGWQKISGAWYYFDGNGAMQTGWEKIGAYWYYFNGSGRMVTGWQKVGSAWYYMDGSGKMVSGKWVGNYYMLPSGAMATNQYIGSYWVGADGRWVP